MDQMMAQRKTLKIYEVISNDDAESLTPIFNNVVVPGLELHMHSEEAITSILKARERVHKVGSGFKVEVQPVSRKVFQNQTSSASALPTARQCGFQDYTGTASIIAGRIKLNNGLIDDLENEPHKVIDKAAGEILGVREVLKCEYERQSVGDGGGTHLCTIASATVGSESDTWVTVVVTMTPIPPALKLCVDRIFPPGIFEME